MGLNAIILDTIAHACLILTISWELATRALHEVSKSSGSTPKWLREAGGLIVRLDAAAPEAAPEAAHTAAPAIAPEAPEAARPTRRSTGSTGPGSTEPSPDNTGGGPLMRPASAMIRAPQVPTSATRRAGHPFGVVLRRIASPPRPVAGFAEVSAPAPAGIDPIPMELPSDVATAPSSPAKYVARLRPPAAALRTRQTAAAVRLQAAVARRSARHARAGAACVQATCTALFIELRAADAAAHSAEMTTRQAEQTARAAKAAAALTAERGADAGAAADAEWTARLETQAAATRRAEEASSALAERSGMLSRRLCRASVFAAASEQRLASLKARHEEELAAAETGRRQAEVSAAKSRLDVDVAAASAAASAAQEERAANEQRVVAAQQLASMAAAVAEVEAEVEAQACSGDAAATESCTVALDLRELENQHATATAAHRKEAAKLTARVAAAEAVATAALDANAELEEELQETRERLKTEAAARKRKTADWAALQAKYAQEMAAGLLARSPGLLPAASQAKALPSPATIGESQAPAALTAPAAGKGGGRGGRALATSTNRH